MKARGPVFHSSKKSKDKDRLPNLKSPLNVHETIPSPSHSSLAPAYVRSRGIDKREGSLQVEDTCRNFEKYLVEMIVEEGNMRDLMDVEELLYCWKNLKCPVFTDLDNEVPILGFTKVDGKE
ncbi:Transcription repressor OFP17, partial [Mucuna pruriens]